MFPVMNAVKTFPRPRKLIASTEPDESVSPSSSKLRIPAWLLWPSTLPKDVVRDSVLMRSIPFSLNGGLRTADRVHGDVPRPLPLLLDAALRVEIADVAALGARGRVDRAID